MEKRLRQLLDGEDKRNPYTDQELADKLSVRREEVTLLRNKLGIPDSRERRREQLTADAEEILRKEPDISARALTDRLRALGYDVSRYVAAQLLKALAAKTDEPKRSTHSEFDAFAHLIGWDGSLRTQIQQAKAAVIYPPNGLHTLILGESGTGKSELAEAMYRYSLESGQRPGSAPFVVFNCADYAENPQLLISQLFGHARGAYTGANEDKAGLVEKANGGFLFLDEVHRLPPEGQEILYSIIDKGCYRRLGESGNWREVNLMLIAATTENPESALLAPFRRRIPMVIELPPLRSRPLTERLEIILHFFRLEAARLRKKLVVRRDVLRALLSGDKPGNVGQIKSDIQVACARGYLNHFGSHSAEEIEVTLNELSPSSRRGLLDSNFRQQMEELLPGDKTFFPDNGEQKIHIFRDNFYTVSDEIYTRIEELVEKGRSLGLPPDEASSWVSQQIEDMLSSIIQRYENLKADLTTFDIEKVIGPELTAAMVEMIGIASKDLDIDEKQLFFYLAIHVHTALERVQMGKPIINPQLAKVKKNHEQEYLTALKMAAVIKRVFNVTLPDDEIGFIALYLRTFSKQKPEEGHVAVLVLSHGGIAREMVNVVHALLQDEHTHALDMALTEKPEAFLSRVIEKAKDIDQGKGILLLVDMGSLLTFGEIIEEELGIPVRVVDRVDLVMVLEATRWAMLAGAQLDEIADELILSKRTSFRPPKSKHGKPLVVTVCLAGIGVAEKIRDYLEETIGSSGIEFKTIGLLDDTRFKHKLEEWRQSYNIAAIVGTINPEVPDIPFLSFQSITEGHGMEYLRSLAAPWLIHRTADSTEFVNNEMILPKVPWQDKETIILELGKILLEKGFVRDGYIESVFEREAVAPTCIKGGIAIPHADPKYVIKPGIAVATLSSPIDWWGMEIDVVFLLALRVGDRQLFSKLLQVFNDEEKMSKIRNAGNPVVIEEELSKCI